MLTFLRDKSSSWVVKILLGLLVLSFATWGIGSWTSGWGRGKAPLSIGDMKISTSAIQRELNITLHQFKAISGNKMKIDTGLRAMALQDVIQKIITRTLLDITTYDLGLKVSDHYIRNEIQNMPQFQDETGQFNRQRFDFIMSQNGFSEDQFIQVLKNEITRNVLIGSIGSSITAPEMITEQLYFYRAQKRLVDLVYIPLNQISLSLQPKEEDLQTIYQENKAQFMKPEYRKISMIQIKQDHVKNELANPTQDAIYEALYKRSTELEDTLAGGATFEEAAKTLGLKLSNLSPVTRTGQTQTGATENPNLLTSDILELAFSLEEGVESNMIENQTDGSFTVIKVTRIIPEEAKDFNTVKPNLISLWKEKQLKQEAQKTAKDMMEQINKGRTAAVFGESFHVEKNRLISRFDKNISTDLVQRIFSLKKNTADYIQTDKEYIVSVLKDIKSPEKETYAAGMKELQPSLSSALTKNMLDSFMASLQKKNKVVVRDAVLNQAFSLTEEEGM